MSKHFSDSYIKGLLQKMTMCSSNDSDIFSPQNFSLNNIVSTLKDNYINNDAQNLKTQKNYFFTRKLN